MKSKILKFCISSLSSFLIDYTLYSIMLFVLPDFDIMVIVANITARVVSASCNYYINRRFVFDSQKSSKSALSYFLLALFILVMNSTVLGLLTHKLHINAFAAKIITECIMFTVSYLVQSRFIFKKRNEKNEQ